MPIGDPPTKPAEDASEADLEKYREEFEAYVARKLAEFADVELNLKREQKETADKHHELADKEKELAGQKKVLASERLKVETREAVVESGEENLRAEEKEFSDKMAKLRLEQAAVKVEVRRSKAWQELEEIGPVGGGLPSGLADILVQQKTLLEKQVKLEEEREKREKEEKEKRD